MRGITNQQLIERVNAFLNAAEDEPVDFEEALELLEMTVHSLMILDGLAKSFEAREDLGKLGRWPTVKD